MRVLKKLLPDVRGRQAQRHSKLAAFICGILASGSIQLPKVARKMFSKPYPSSREKPLSQ
jgi:hypothetical protein